MVSGTNFVVMRTELIKKHNLYVRIENWIYTKEVHSIYTYWTFTFFIFLDLGGGAYVTNIP